MKPFTTTVEIRIIYKLIFKKKLFKNFQRDDVVESVVFEKTGNLHVKNKLKIIHYKTVNQLTYGILWSSMRWLKIIVRKSQKNNLF